MLRINIVTVGKDKGRWITEGINHYRKLLSKFARVEFQLVGDADSSPSLSPDEVMKRQARLLEKKLDRSLVIALSEKGEKFDSLSFAKLLERLQISSGGTVSLVIGGAYGLDKSILKRADKVISLSDLTFSHQLCRLVILEQLYRGFSILHGSNYHK